MAKMWVRKANDRHWSEWLGVISHSILCNSRSPQYLRMKQQDALHSESNSNATIKQLLPSHKSECGPVNSERRTATLVAVCGPRKNCHCSEIEKWLKTNSENYPFSLIVALSLQFSFASFYFALQCVICDSPGSVPQTFALTPLSHVARSLSVRARTPVARFRWQCPSYRFWFVRLCVCVCLGFCVILAITHLCAHLFNDFTGLCFFYVRSSDAVSPFLFRPRVGEFNLS